MTSDQQAILATCYREGRSAALLNSPESSNPYSPARGELLGDSFKGHCFDLWSDGWRDGVTWRE